jgi:hypothetical protein
MNTEEEATMLKVILLLDCNECGRSYDRAYVCSGKRSEILQKVDEVIDEAYKHDGWCMNDVSHTCGKCFDAKWQKAE